MELVIYAQGVGLWYGERHYCPYTSLITWKTSNFEKRRQRILFFCELNPVIRDKCFAGYILVGTSSHLLMTTMYIKSMHKQICYDTLGQSLSDHQFRIWRYKVNLLTWFTNWNNWNLFYMHREQCAAGHTQSYIDAQTNVLWRNFFINKKKLF